MPIIYADSYFVRLSNNQHEFCSRFYTYVLGKKGGPPCKKRFSLKGLWGLRAKEIHQIACESCCEVQDIDNLVFGFPPPGKDFREELKIIVAEGVVTGVAGLESRLQNAVTILLRAFGSESRSGPRLFSVLPRDLSKFNPNNIGMEGYYLNLWCEMPGHQHPTSTLRDGVGEYTFERPKEWLAKAAPYISFTGQVIKGLIPLVQAAGAFVGPDDILGRISLMTSAVNSLLEGDFETRDFRVEPRDIYRKPAEGEALRELHSLLAELDPKKHWGGLRRTPMPTPTGDYLWLCPKHYPIYNPGELKLD